MSELCSAEGDVSKPCSIEGDVSEPCSLADAVAGVLVVPVVMMNGVINVGGAYKD